MNISGFAMGRIGLATRLSTGTSGVLICFIDLNMWVNIMVLALNPGPQFAAIIGNPGGITVLVNLVFRQKIWGARDNGIPPRSTPELWS